MIKIQNIIFPSNENCTEKELYFRDDGEVEYTLGEKEILFNEKDAVYFDTYFNSFSAFKWFKYTKVKNIGLHLCLKGKIKIILNYKERLGNDVLQKLVNEYVIDTDGEVEEADFIYGNAPHAGMYSFDVIALEHESEFRGGYYFSDNSEDDLREVNISLIICTYKREEYIYRNIKMLENTILADDSEMKGHFHVMISDNSHTLDSAAIRSENVHIFENKNVGGSGGFTRGLIESLKLKEKHHFTHVLLMDDDVVVQPESFYRTYHLLTLLKDEYEDCYIGGSMLRTDRQFIQTESGGVWNSGRLISHKANLDLRSCEACLYNEVEEKCDFTAWWYCTMPISIIQENNLPLPIFIRGDDVEYGLRNMKKLILMNGICVWHEPFENKYSSSMYYYIFRNRLIDNAIHNLSYSKETFLAEFEDWFKRELFTLRYKNCRLLMKGVNDFLRGISWFKEQDGEQLNQEVMEEGYKFMPLEELSIAFDYPQYEQTLRFCESKKQRKKRILKLNGLFEKPVKSVIVPVQDAHIAWFYRASRALNYDYGNQKGFETYFDRKEAIALIKEYRKLRKNVKKNYQKVYEEYGQRKEELTNLNFWKEYLNL